LAASGIIRSNRIWLKKRLNARCHSPTLSTVNFDRIIGKQKINNFDKEISNWLQYVVRERAIYPW
jgi:hypothetical protein